MAERPWQKHYDYFVPASIRYPRYPAQKIFHLSAAAFPDKAATNFYGTEITYRQLRNQVLRMANALAAIGVKKGERVGVQLPNSPQFVIAYLATMHLGGIVVNINPLYTYDELRFIAQNTQMETLITFDMALPVVRPLAKEVGLKRVIVTKATDYIDGFGVSSAKSLDLEEGWHHFSALIEGCNNTKVPRIDVFPQDPAMIQFTGGTTGFPKGALLTHGNLTSACFQAGLWGPPGAYASTVMPVEERCVLSVLPYFHVYGNVVAMNWAMFTCSTQIIVPRFEVEEILETISKFKRITYFPAVPTMITAIVNHPKASTVDLSAKLGLLNSGGAPMPVELIEQVIDMNIPFSEGYGLSETAALGISNPLSFPKTGSIGIPMPDNDVRLVNVDNGVEDAKEGEPGEIILRGPTVMKGYWNNPEETNNQLHDGWLYTGDVAIRDEEGFFFIVDRKKDLIIAGGFNIYPREVEEVLYENPDVAEAVVVGVPDEYRGETVKAFLVLKPGAKSTEKDIVEFCKKKLTAYKVPKKVEFRETLPKSAVGKILRKNLREEEKAKTKKS